MKKFNLEAALNGEPVKLRNGQKATIYYCTPAEIKFDENTPDTFPLKGMVFYEKGYLEDPLVTWRCDGRFRYSEDDWDIIGMWEEPKISIEDLPKPFKPTMQEQYFTITSKYKYEPLYVEETANFNTPIDNNLINQGNAFRTREDAQKWLDFMKSMME